MFTLGEMAWMFLIYSVMGWIWETSYVSIRHKKLINRGFLRGPIVPIYGFAATTIMVSLRLSDPYLKIEGWGRIVLIFIFSAFVATVWEYVTSAILEGLFKTRWWDYSKLRFNIKGRIAISVSAFWGVGSTILWLYVNKSFISFYHRVPEAIMKVELIGIYFLIFIDVVFTVMELFNFRKHVMKFQQTSDELLIRRFKEDLNKLKGNVRFFKNYPDAKTKHFQLLFNVRKLDSIQEAMESRNGRKCFKNKIEKQYEENLD